MRVPQWVAARAVKGITLALVLVFAGASIGFVHAARSSRLPPQAPDKLAASIFSFDGHDFIRTQTTLLTQDGKSAVSTKLDRDTPAYKALVQGHSYSGAATVFGHNYDANYAPLTGSDGKVTGALFVAVAK